MDTGFGRRKHWPPVDSPTTVFNYNTKKYPAKRKAFRGSNFQESKGQGFFKNPIFQTPKLLADGSKTRPGIPTTIEPKEAEATPAGDVPEISNAAIAERAPDRTQSDNRIFSIPVLFGVFQ